MTDFGRKQGDMRRSVYDPNKDGVLAVAQTEADMTKAVYDPALAVIAALLANHSAEHESGGDDELDVTGLVGTTPRALLADATPGRVFRGITFVVSDGTDPNTLLCWTDDEWNGDAIAAQDNIAKGATTGHFTLSADGTILDVLNAAFTGSVLYAIGRLYSNTSGTMYTNTTRKIATGTRHWIKDGETGILKDFTEIVDTISIAFHVLYITDA